MEIKERQALLSSTANPELTQENDERQNDDDDDEAISLRNLPLIHHHEYEENEEEEGSIITPLETQDDFNFCSPLEESISQMRAADEIFFRGRILPLHNSISRSQSMDHHYSSSRSSSTNSHHSSSTSSGGGGCADSKLALRNKFYSHSHPSPSPRILSNRQQTIRNNNRNRCDKKSLSWNVFRGGLIAAPPEIALGDLKSRCSGKNKKSSEKKRVKAWDIIVGGCKCSVDATEIAIMKRSASREDDNSAPTKKSVNHRTSEWLKQLSLQGSAAAER